MYCPVGSELNCTVPELGQTSQVESGPKVPQGHAHVASAEPGTALRSVTWSARYKPMNTKDSVTSEKDTGTA